MPDEVDAAQSAPKSKRMLTLLILAAVMLAEGGLIFGAMKIFGAAPAASSAGQLTGGETTKDDADSGGSDLVEVAIAETDAFNNRSGRLYMYHLQVTAVVKSANREAMERLVEERSATMRDRINTVIRGADPNHLNEPGLETARRQIKFELNKIVGDDTLILELLIPKLLQTRTGL